MILHTVTDLQAYYNRQLQNLYGIIEELVELDRNTMKLFMKVIIIMIPYIYTAHSVSSISYRGIEEEIAGTG